MPQSQPDWILKNRHGMAWILRGVHVLRRYIVPVVVINVVVLLALLYYLPGVLHHRSKP
jgi:hypothetical protein